MQKITLLHKVIQPKGNSQKLNPGHATYEVRFLIVPKQCKPILERKPKQQ